MVTAAVGGDVRDEDVPFIMEVPEATATLLSLPTDTNSPVHAIIGEVYHACYGRMRRIGDRVLLLVPKLGTQDAIFFDRFGTLLFTYVAPILPKGLGYKPFLTGYDERRLGSSIASSVT